MNTKPVNAATLFCCYAHADEPLRDELEKHQAALKRSGDSSSWHDRQIQAGTQWQQEIETHLTSASLILLLISPDFIYSDACDVEMQKALALHHAGRARALPNPAAPGRLGSEPSCRSAALACGWQAHHDLAQSR